MANLITLDRALQQIPSAADCDKPVVSSLIGAASSVIEAYCRRTFAQATYDEFHTFSSPARYLFVNNPPVARVDWVRTTPLPAVQIQNIDGNNLTQQATVDVTTTGITLTRIYNNTTTTTTLSFASYPTFDVLGTAINAVGGNWSASVPAQFALWQTADLTSNTGSYSARNATVTLNVYWFYLSNFRVNESLGEIYNPGGFVPGYQLYRVKYTGGYATIPEDIQQACAELVQATFASIQANPLMSSQTIDKYSYTRAATTSFDNLSVASKLTLNNYRVLKVARYK
jgi:hypothetical protein